jgi:hypothetical protein
MQEVWEAYMKPVDGRPAAVAFNAEVAERIPDAELGVMGFVKVPLRTPTTEGFVSESEADELGFVEDRLEMEALRYRIGKYVGRVLTGGEANFIFYLKYDFEWPGIVAAAMEHFPAYAYESGSRADAEWEVYRKLLFPTGREWQMIHNHRTCDRLKAAGDNLRLARAIEHRVYFETVQARGKFAQRIADEGFKVQKELPPSEQAPLYGLQFYRIDTPYYYDIDALTLSLIDLGERFRGVYDGWETSLVKM